jgi:hypothetical protein
MALRGRTTGERHELCLLPPIEFTPGGRPLRPPPMERRLPPSGHQRAPDPLNRRAAHLTGADNGVIRPGRPALGLSGFQYDAGMGLGPRWCAPGVEESCSLRALFRGQLYLVFLLPRPSPVQIIANTAGEHIR